MSPITIRLRQYRGGFYRPSLVERTKFRLNKVAFRLPWFDGKIAVRWADLAAALVWIVGTWVALAIVTLVSILWDK